MVRRSSSNSPIVPRHRSWSDAEAAAGAASSALPQLGLRAYSSRLIGADPSLTLAGGGNTSLKGRQHNLLGDEIDVLWVKGSGADLATIEARQFCALHLTPVLRLLTLDALSDRDLRQELLRARLDPDAPPPSVETLLHAFLPFRFVDHAHPDALLTLTQTPDGARRAERLYGADCVIVPYVKPGFDLALAARRCWERSVLGGATPRGILLLHHGLFTFADEARDSYETLCELAARAEARLPTLPRRARRASDAPVVEPWRAVAVAALRAELSRAAGRPLVVELDASQEARAFAAEPRVRSLAARGPLTPDHVLRTKRVALVVAAPRAIASAVERYAAAYRREFELRRRGRDLAMLDPAPRVVVVPGTGIFAAGPSAREATVALAIYRQTARAIRLAERLGGWRPLSPAATFEVENWALEQAKLERAGAPAPLAGRVALVTGAASGIGRACVEALRQAGAAVVGLDRVPVPGADDLLSLTVDVTAPGAVEAALDTAVRRFGGLDIVVSNVGVFPPGRSLDELSDEAWRRAFTVNVDSHLSLLRGAAPLLRLSPTRGAVVVIGSKNVPAPGPGAAAYSASKAALTQLARVAALELAPAGVRVNVVHPDGVFDTGVWTPAVLAERARRYGLTIEQYRRRNLLGIEIRSTDVAQAVVALAGDLFRATTGAQLPIDGGSDRVI